MSKVVVNRCFGGFGLSQKAYERLIELGIPVRKYINQKRDPNTHRYLPESKNEGEVIFDCELTPEGEDELNDFYYKYPDGRVSERYWETWTSDNRSHPLLVQVVEELGKEANGMCAELEVVEIPDDVEWEIDEYDGHEHVAEKHRTW